METLRTAQPPPSVQDNLESDSVDRNSPKAKGTSDPNFVILRNAVYSIYFIFIETVTPLFLKGPFGVKLVPLEEEDDLKIFKVEKERGATEGFLVQKKLGHRRQHSTSGFFLFNVSFGYF